MSLLKKLGKAVKKVVRVAAPVALPFVAGPLGAVAGAAISRALGPTAGAVVSRALPQALTYAAQPRVMPGGGEVVAQRLPVPRAPTVPRAPGRTSTGPVTGPTTRRKITPFGDLPRVSRALAEGLGWIAFGAYWLHEGVVVAARTQRRMNPLNARALRRAIRRVHGATRICREVERITTPRRRGTRSRGRGSARAEAACR